MTSTSSIVSRFPVALRPVHLRRRAGRPHGSLLAGLFALGSQLGCGLVINGEELGDEGGVEQDIAEYEEMVATLEAEREQALGDEVVALGTSGSWLAWIEGSTLGLRRYPDQLELELSAPTLGYRLSDSHLLMRDPADAGVGYRGLSLPDGELIDEQLMSATTSPFCLLGDVATLLDGGALLRWRIGVEAPVALGQLGELGITDTEVTALEAIDAGRVLIHADDRLWRIELDAFAASEVAVLDELLAVDARGALLRRDDGLYFHEHSGESLRIDAAIADAGWSLNPTFATIHEYSGDGATLSGDRVLYIGRAGLFAFALDEAGPEAVAPLLIEPRWNVNAGIPRIEYREPKAAGGGVFVRGLIGESGELGETGPIFAVLGI